jgi:hypothetical protein
MDNITLKIENKKERIQFEKKGNHAKTTTNSSKLYR